MKTHHLFASIRHIAVASVLVISTTSAFAHSSLESAVPAVNAIVSTQPDKLVMSFGEPVMLMGIKLVDEKQTNIELNYKVTSGLKNTYEVAAPKLADSTYTVVWTTMGKDGHNMSGKYNFSLKQSAQATLKTTLKTPSHNAPSLNTSLKKDHSTMKHHNHSQQ